MQPKSRWLLIFLLPILAFLSVQTVQAQNTPVFAEYDGGLSNDGRFTGCTELPEFTYSVTGDFAPGDTDVPGDPQVIDNNGGGFEAIFGPADNVPNIEVEVAGFFGSVGDPITNTVVTTITFDGPVPPNRLAFIIADVEQDQVTICAQDECGDVPVSTIGTWFQTAFDADAVQDGNVNVPSWDAATGTLVGELSSAPVMQTEYVATLGDNEAGAAWFMVNTPITQLTFKSQALGLAPDDPSQHFILAAMCNTCPVPNCAEITIID